MPQFLDYYQLAGLAVFFVAVTARAVHLRIRQKVSPIRLRVTDGGKGHIISLVVFLTVFLWTLCVLIYGIGRNAILPILCNVPVLQNLTARIVGALLIFWGLAVFLLALRHLGASWRLGIDERTPGKLVTRGIYSITRNPIFVFFDLYFAGTFLVNGTLIFLIFGLVLPVLLHLQILEEERTLRKLYPQAYPAYCARTARYLTWEQAWHASTCLRASPSSCSRSGCSLPRTISPP